MQALSEWVRGLGSFNLPVLQHTVAQLAALRAREENVTARDIAEVVLSDPLMSVKVLRFSQSRLTSRQPTEVTTVEHAVMMHGVANFFRQFRDLGSLEGSLAGEPEALRGALAVVSRAYHAAVNARNFAALRHDMEGEEPMISALLHDLAEMLLWCMAPAAATQIEQMLLSNKGLRSVSAQNATLGFPLADLQLALAREWRLPKLLQHLMDDRHATNPRVVTVHLSVALARHAAHGWYDPALPDDYMGLQKLLNLPSDQVKRWVRQSALQAARAWKHCSVRPAAAWLPMLPGDWPVPEVRAATSSGPARDALLARCWEQLAAAGKYNSDLATVVALAFYALQAGLGLRRLWLGKANPVSGKVEPCHSLLLDPGLGAEELAFELGSRSLFARLMERPQGVWYSVGNRDKLMSLLPEELRLKIGAHDFFAMSLHHKGTPSGLLYADAGAGSLDDPRYTAFKQVCAAMSAALERAGRLAP